jgi:hypothetical protein
MRTHILLSLFNRSIVVITLLSSVQAIADSECKNRSVCAYSQMPLLQQGSPEMQYAIAQVSGGPFPGLCGPTTFTMVMQGYAREYGIEKSIYGDIRSQSSIDLTVKNFQNTSRCEETGPFSIIKICDDGSGMQGTSPTSAHLLMNRFAQSTVETVSLPPDKQFYTPGIIQSCEGTEGGGGMSCVDKVDYDNPVLVDAVQDTDFLFDNGTPDLVNDFRNHKNSGYITLCAKTESFLGKDIPTDCHYLAINGIEGSRVKLYDPWGSIYTVTQSGSRIINPSSAFGFVSNRGGDVELIGYRKFKLSVFWSESFFGTHRFYKNDTALDARRANDLFDFSAIVGSILDFN